MHLTVMTFNLRVDVSEDGDNAWPHRSNDVGALIRDVNPDLLGTQEGRYGMLRELDAELPGYGRFGEGRAGRESGDPSLDECCVIYYKLDTLRLAEQGQFYLSRTPEIPGSVSWNSSLTRLCTWGLFESVRTPGERLYLFNTHLDHMSREAREKGAALIAGRIRSQRSLLDAPVILTGDFNATPEEPAIAVLKADLNDAYAALPEPPGATFHDFQGGTAGEPIDYIFASRDLALSAVVVHRTHRNGAYPSDHYPVSCQVGRSN